MRTLAFTVVTVLSFAALPAVAEDPAVEEAAIDAAVEDVLQDDPTPTVETPLSEVLPDTVPSARLDTPDAVFLADAIASAEADIAAAELAQDRSDDIGIKALAARIEADLETLVDRLGKLPGAGAEVQPRGNPAQPEMARLQTLEDAAFDAAWLAVQEKHHRQALDRFERASTSPALDTNVRSAAAEALTTLRAHADDLRNLRDSLGYE